jgi:vacuolar-type H+-ATPase subunit E/Vma4
MMAPSTEQERRTIGPVRDRAIESGSEAVEKTLDRARQGAMSSAQDEAMKSFGEAARETVDTARQELQQHS